MDLQQIYKQISTPSSVLHESEQFLIKLAENEEEVEKALRLRYEIFNLEQGKGLKSAENTGIDQDEFDDYCFHLIVFEKEHNKAIGTYRIHHGKIAHQHKGFYSEREYDIQGIERIAEDTLEVGRSCVAPEFRNGAAVALLWGGIGELLIRARLRYLLGCVSLEITEPSIGWTLYQHFQNSGFMSEIIAATAQPSFALEKPPTSQINDFLQDKVAVRRAIPPLLKGYLRLGTKICGEPALDAEFGTIDYLILLDTGTIPERYARHFNYELVEDKRT